VEWGAHTVIEAKTTTTFRTESHYIGEKPPLQASEKDPATLDSVKNSRKECTDKEQKKSETGKTKQENHREE
jgi:hypothetical protein